jgi:hypothetical protein
MSLQHREFLAHLLHEFPFAAEVFDPLSALESEPELMPTLSRPGTVRDYGSLLCQGGPLIVAQP